MGKVDLTTDSSELQVRPAEIVLVPELEKKKKKRTEIQLLMEWIFIIVTVRSLRTRGTGPYLTLTILVNFSVSGPGFIAGVDQWQSESVTSQLKANHRKAFHGLAMAIVTGSKGQSRSDCR
jgi:hypothetical protein